MQTKQLIFLFIAMCFAPVVKSQTEKGSVYVGGNILFARSTDYPQQGSSLNETTKQILVSPSIAKAYRDNRFGGLSLTWLQQTYTYGGTGADSSLNYSVPSLGAAVFLRQYKPLGKGFWLFAHEQLSASVSFGKLYGYSFRGVETELSLSPGLAYNVSKHMQLEMVIGDLLSAVYSSSRQKGSGTAYAPQNNGNEFVLSSSLQGSPVINMSLGIRFFLGAKS